ncbi:hypothetical protein [Runella sp.]|jgi:hypothetical protein
MKISFQKVSTDTDFWNSLSPYVKQRIEKGLADAGNFTTAQDYLKQLMAQ